VSGAVLERAWALVHRGLKKAAEKGALYEAIISGDLAEVQLYACVGLTVDKTIGMMPSAWETENSPLQWAAIYNKLEIVRFFVESGRTTEIYDNDGGRHSPLVAAAEEGHVKVVRYLVEQGAMTSADYSGYSPMSIAAERGHFDVVRCLSEQGVDKGEDNEAMSLACSHGHVGIAEYLLDVRHVDILYEDDEGWTALHDAAQGGHLEVAQLLFRYGAKLDALNNEGRTPADLAIDRGHHDIADAIRAEELRRRDHGFKRDRSTIEGTEEHEASKRPREEREAEEAAAAAAAAAPDESDDDDDDDDDDDEEEG